MPYAVDSELLLYADDTYMVFQRRNIKIIDEQLNRDFSILIHWFVDSKLAKRILVRTKQNPFFKSIVYLKN